MHAPRGESPVRSLNPEPMTRTFPKPIPFLLCACFLIEAGAAPAPPRDKDRLDALVQYAETILVHGRDSYGEEHTPLFVDALEVNTLKAPEKMYIHRLGGPGPPGPPATGRPVSSACTITLSTTGCRTDCSRWAITAGST